MRVTCIACAANGSNDARSAVVSDMKLDLGRFTSAVRRYGPLGTVAWGATRLAGSVGLRLGLEYSAPAARVVTANPNALAQATFEVIRGVSVSELWSHLRELNPWLAAQPSDLGVDRVAVARNPELLGYWCFAPWGADLLDRGLFVVPHARGNRLAAGLLQAMAHELPPSTVIFAEVAPYNRASRRAVRHGGLELTGLSIGLRFRGAQRT